MFILIRDHFYYAFTLVVFLVQAIVYTKFRYNLVQFRSTFITWWYLEDQIFYEVILNVKTILFTPHSDSHTSAFAEVYTLRLQVHIVAFL